MSKPKQSKNRICELRNVGIILVGVVALSLLVGVVSATTWTVDDSGSADFTRIQDAINASNPGDTLEVRSGTYYENVNIDKQLTLIGVDTSGGMPVVDGESGNAIIFSAEGITLDGFEVINKGSLSCVTLYYSSNNMIVNNIVFTVGNGYCGFWLYNSNNNMFINNKISNMGTGIYLDDYSNNNTLIDNTASSNMDGIHLGHYSNSNTLINNNLKYNSDYGIWLEYSSNNIIADNYVSDNGYTGIKFTSSNNNKLTNNIVSNNWESIWFCYSDNNMLINNVISNSNTGIGISRSSNNEIYLNNFMDNIENAYDNDNNQWDNGTIGNHYSNFDEPCESCIDADGDGICDSSYPIPGGGSGEDRFPLVSWSTPSENQAPVITSITPDPPEVGTGRSSTITIIASDPDGDTLSYSYIPTDGEISGSGSVVTWTAPPIAGTYRVDVTVSDGEKSASDSVFFTVVDPISINVEWFDESDEMVVPYDEIKLKFTIKNNLPTTLHNVKLLFQSNTDLITLEKGSIDIGSIAPGEENSDAINSIIIEGVDNENILDEIIDADGAGELFLTNSIVGTVEYDSGSQGFTLTPTDEYDNPLYIQYPDFSQHPEVGDPDLEYYREGDVDFSHTTDILVRKYAVVGAATDPNTEKISVFPDNPADVTFNVFRYVDEILKQDEAPGIGENDIWIVNELYKDTLKNRHPWICISHAYLFTSFERALGFPSREIDVAEGIHKIGPVTVYTQNGAAEVWHKNDKSGLSQWNFYDPWTSSEAKYILKYEDLLGTKVGTPLGVYPIVAYKAWHAFDKQTSPTFANSNYKGHNFGLDSLKLNSVPEELIQWKLRAEGQKSGVNNLIIAGSPIKMLVRDDQGMMVGSTDAGIVNELFGAEYMPPGQIGYSDRGDPSTAFELDEFISLPDDLIGDYELIVKGTDNGEYTLQFAKFDSSAADEYSDVTTFTYTIKENELHRYEVSIDDTINPVRILQVNLDIKPGSCTNPLNTKSKGVLTAAILGTEELDVSTINPETILLGRDDIENRVAPIRWSYEDVAAPFTEESCDYNDFNDGYMDLVFKFETQMLVSTLELEEATEEIISLTLTGDFEDENVSVEGEDRVLVLKQN